MRIAGRDRVDHLHHFPRRAILIDHRTLEEFLILPVEPPLSERSPQQHQVVPPRWSRRSRGSQRRLAIDRAMAIDTVDLDSIASLTVDLSVAMIILREMTIGTV